MTEVEAAVQILMDYRVPSFSPNTGMQLLDIATRLHQAIVAKLESVRPLTAEDQEALRILAGYRDALRLVADMGVHHQGAVIETFATLIGAPHTGQENAG